MAKRVIALKILLFMSISVFMVSGCESEAQNTALLGAAVGAGVGALAGDTEGALIGAAVGGGAGYMLGGEADRKKEQQQTQRQIDQLREENQTVTMWITNTNGSKTPVALRRSGPNYIGPNGEVYDSLPSEESLKIMYGH